MRTREDIFEELNNLNKNGLPDSRDLRAELILMEVFLDIRECLDKLIAHQGVQRWGAKIGPAADGQDT